jgi:hypothetical protein
MTTISELNAMSPSNAARLMRTGRAVGGFGAMSKTAAMKSMTSDQMAQTTGKDVGMAAAVNARPNNEGIVGGSIPASVEAIIVNTNAMLARLLAPFASIIMAIPSPGYYPAFTRDFLVRPVDALINLITPFDNLLFEIVARANNISGVRTRRIGLPGRQIDVPMSMTPNEFVPSGLNATIADWIRRVNAANQFLILSWADPVALARSIAAQAVKDGTKGIEMAVAFLNMATSRGVALAGVDEGITTPDSRVLKALVAELKRAMPSLAPFADAQAAAKAIIDRAVALAAQAQADADDAIRKAQADADAAIRAAQARADSANTEATRQRKAVADLSSRVSAATREAARTRAAQAQALADAALAEARRIADAAQAEADRVAAEARAKADAAKAEADRLAQEAANRVRGMFGGFRGFGALGVAPVVAGAAAGGAGGGAVAAEGTVTAAETAEAAAPAATPGIAVMILAVLAAITAAAPAVVAVAKTASELAKDLPAKGGEAAKDAASSLPVPESVPKPKSPLLPLALGAGALVALPVAGPLVAGALAIGAGWSLLSKKSAMGALEDELGIGGFSGFAEDMQALLNQGLTAAQATEQLAKRAAGQVTSGGGSSGSKDPRAGRRVVEQTLESLGVPKGSAEFEQFMATYVGPNATIRKINDDSTNPNIPTDVANLLAQMRAASRGNTNTDMVVAPKPRGMSTGAKVGIGIGALAVVAVGYKMATSEKK